MELLITTEHMEKGVKGCPVRNPISLAMNEYIEDRGQLGFVSLSFDGLLVVRDLDGQIVMSSNLGQQATHFLDMWYAGVDIAVPFTVQVFPVC